MDLIFFLQVKRYAEMSRKLRFFHDQVAKAGKLAYRPIMENVTDLDELDHKLGDLESELLEINANNDKLQSSQSELTELKLVLQNVSFTLPFVLWQSYGTLSLSLSLSLSLFCFSFFFFLLVSLWFVSIDLGVLMQDNFAVFFPFGLTNVVVKDSAISTDENLCVYLVWAHLWSSPKFYNFLLFVFVGVFCFERGPHFSTPQGILKMANNCSRC